MPLVLAKLKAYAHSVARSLYECSSRASDDSRVQDLPDTRCLDYSLELIMASAM